MLEKLASKLDYSKREKLAKFMLSISKGYALVPYICLTKDEIRNAVFRRVGLPTRNLKGVVGKGIASTLGPWYIKSNKLPGSLKQKLIEATESPKTFLWFIMNHSDHFREGRKVELKYVEMMEEIRREYAKIVDNNLRRRVNFARYFKSVISPEIGRVCIKFDLHPENIFPNNTTKEDAEKFFQDIPTHYTSLVLHFRRDVQKDRKVDKNDFNDIAALSIAIPYCDIVITEKFWTSIALHEKLDKIYNTVILSSVGDLHNFL